ncbi:MAG: inhibitor of the KinA pathway to sporulation, predicted exonuclease [Symbiobacteriaceae bacterium]|jgi:inhibitor of KinA sporulation pathway (predicted exonuclease)|nr:inhibitor of the KinA pathway to sporulation, predicted exonuclease [Symbiobacteriaceae bacterium]
MHGAFARPARTELMEVAAQQYGGGPAATYRTLVRCDLPDTPQGDGTDGSATGVTEEENRRAPAPAEVFAHLKQTFSLDSATVVMWGNMAYRLHEYVRSKGLENPLARAQVLDLQAAAAMHFDLKTGHCKTPRNAVQSLNLTPEGDYWSSGSVPAVRGMHAILGKLLASDWTPASTPAAIISGSEMGEAAEEMRIERWEQLRERQNNLGIERRPLPQVVPAFIVLDCEHVSLRRERFSRLIEVALVVAERHGDGSYALSERSFSSLVQVENVEDAWSKSWEMTGINPADVRKAPPLPEVMTSMVAAAPWGNGVLVTWGPDDAQVITQNCVKTGIPSPITEVPLIDVQRAFSRFYGLESRQVGLQNAAAYLGIDTTNVDLHRALSDTVVTWQIMHRMLADGWTPGWRSWNRSGYSSL